LLPLNPTKEDCNRFKDDYYNYLLELQQQRHACVQAHRNEPWRAIAYTCPGKLDMPAACVPIVQESSCATSDFGRQINECYASVRPEPPDPSDRDVLSRSALQSLTSGVPDALRGTALRMASIAGGGSEAAESLRRARFLDRARRVFDGVVADSDATKKPAERLKSLVTAIAKISVKFSVARDQIDVVGEGLSEFQAAAFAEIMDNIQSLSREIGRGRTGVAGPPRSGGVIQDIANLSAEIADDTRRKVERETREREARLRAGEEARLRAEEEARIRSEEELRRRAEEARRAAAPRVEGACDQQQARTCVYDPSRSGGDEYRVLLCHNGRWVSMGWVRSC
jgi:hypothetical protein